MEGPYCQYCNTPTYTPTDAVEWAHGKRVHCWYEDDGKKTCFDMFVTNISTRAEYEPVYAFGGATMHLAETQRSISIEADMLDFDHAAWNEHMRDWRAS